MTQTARQRQGAESRARILDAAEALISAQGFAATSISQIVRSCGLPASSIYWHFSSKEELLGSVVERGAREWLGSRPTWARYDGDFEAFVEEIGKGVDERPAFLRLWMLLALEGHQAASPPAQRTVRLVWHNVREGLERVLLDHYRLDARPGGPQRAARLARFMLACIDGAFVDGHIDPEGTDTAAVFADMVDALDSLAGDTHDEQREERA